MAVDIESPGVLGERLENAIKALILPLLKAEVGLSNVDDTSDADKPISIATQEVLDSVAATIEDLTELVQGKLDSSSADIFLDKFKNLEDLDDVTAAKINLQIGTAADHSESYFASAAQGERADSAIQPNDSVDLLIEGANNKFLTAVEKDKLAGIAQGATANQIDSYLLSRSNHTGSQNISTISGLGTELSGIHSDIADRVTTVGLSTFSTSLDARFADKIEFDIHKTATNNPHATTAAQVGTMTTLQIFDEIDLSAATLAADISNRVSYTANQTLNDSQKSRVLNNIGAPLLTGFRNKIINGNFAVNQRGLTTQTNSGYGVADRWQHTNNGSTKTVSLQTFTPEQTSVFGNPTNYLRTVVSSVTSENNYCALVHKIEDVRLTAGKTYSLVFWAKADTGRPIAVEFSQVFGTGGTPTAAITGLGIATPVLFNDWYRYIVTVTLPPIAPGTVFGTTANTSFLQIMFWFDAGGTYASRTGSIGQQSGTFDIARVSFVEGNPWFENDPFEFRPYTIEQALCQRYYYSTKSNSSTVYPIGIGFMVSTTTMRARIFTPVALRGNPTIAPGTTYPTVYPNAAAQTIASPGTAAVDDVGVVFSATLTAVTANAPVIIVGKNTSYITFDAEL